MRGMLLIPLMCVTLPSHFYALFPLVDFSFGREGAVDFMRGIRKRIRSDALQAFLKVLTFAYSFFYLIMQYELQCIKFPQ